MATVGLVVNHAAGRDIRRLAGGASVSDAYAKRRAAACALEGVSAVNETLEEREPLAVLAMPDGAGISSRIIEQAPEGLSVRSMDLSVTDSAADTRRAAERFSSTADAVIVLGGDGTTRDVALGIGSVPVASVSTGTNNVVPSPVDATVAGVAAGLIAVGAISSYAVTRPHGMIEADIEARAGDRTIRGLATLGILDRSFVGARAVLSGESFLGGVVSRASPSDIGLSGIAGAVAPHPFEEPGGVGLRLCPPAAAPAVARAITVPGVVERVGVREHRRLATGEEMRFEVEEGVVSVDGEPMVEVQEATVRARPVDAPLRLVSFDAAFDAASAIGWFCGDK